MTESIDLVRRLRMANDPLSREAVREILKLRKLLSEMADEMPDYIDGRYDRLLARVERALL